MKAKDAGALPQSHAHLVDGTAGPSAGSLARGWNKTRQISSGSQDVCNGDIRFWGQSLSNWDQHCLHGLRLGLGVVRKHGEGTQEPIKVGISPFQNIFFPLPISLNKGYSSENTPNSELGIPERPGGPEILGPQPHKILHCPEPQARG